MRPRLPQGRIVLFQTALLLLAFAMMGQPVEACSVAGCGNRGVEMANSFEVVITHEGKPMRGVVVEIKKLTPNETTIVFSTATDAKGRARITKLPAGDYWLNAELLGINASYHCFHVAARPSNGAKRVLNYTWGGFPTPVASRIAGTLTDSQPGTGGTVWWNALNRVVVPITGARLRLQNALTDETFSTTSDAAGSFDFGPVRDGTYVLHIEGGSGRSYTPRDFLVTVRGSSSPVRLRLSRAEICYSPTLDLSFEKIP